MADPALADEQHTDHAAFAARWMPVTLGAGSVLAIVWAASVGEAGGVASVVSAIYLILTASVFPLAYILGSIGLGVPIQRWLAPNARHVWAIRTGLGLGAMLTLTQLLGVSGLLFVRLIAMVPLVVGLLLLAHRLRTSRAEYGQIRPSLPWLAALPALGVLLVASCSPPGWLWSSEAGGYDVLSYHLQLPRDWIGQGRFWPVEHNVYSYLPGYMEGAFAQIIVAMGAGSKPAAMIASDGAPLIACQFLHAWVTVIAAMLTASAGTSMCRRTGAQAPHLCGAIAGAVVLATPWSVVTGSMAYNEMGVIALFASAMVVAMEHKVKPVRRGLVAGVLVGAACGCKPTALLFAAPVVGLTLVWTTDRRFWITLLWSSCLGGLVMLLPWLVRNALAGGNPVFPQLTGLFGSAHWSNEQVARYASGHTFEGSFIDALKLLVVGDPNDPASSSTHVVHRGLLHPQWSLLAPMAVIALGSALVIRRTHRFAALLAISLLVQLGVWLTLTHVQSRFLMPMLVPMALAISLALSPLRRPAMSALGVGVVLILSVSTAMVFSHEQERYGGPNTAMVFGASQFTSPAGEGEDPQTMGPVVFINSQLRPEARVLLVGNAAPLYIDRDVVYATTWDKSVLASLMEQSPSQPEAWMQGLKELGITHIYVDLGEMARLESSNWLDPTLDAQTIIQWLARDARPIYRDERARHLIFELE